MVAESQVKLANGTVTVLSPPSIVCEDDLIQISVCGIIYDVLESTLQRYPNTLLGNPERRHQHFLKSRNLFYFDTNRQCFEAVLYYYQSRGTIIRPADIPLHTFEEDLAFFGLDEIDDGPPSTDKQPTTLKDHYFPWQKKLWDLFEFPDSGPTARVIALWSLFVIAISIVIFCMETMPEFKRRKTIVVRLNNSNMTKTVSVPTRNNAVWFSLELACIVWFTIEFVTRFVCSPNKLQFVKSILNLIDLIAILPYFITVCNPVGSKQHLSILRIVRLVRVFRIFKLSRYSNGLRILGETLQASISELAMLVFFLCLGVLLFSSAMYYAEEGESETFVSIPDAFWYSVVTMTTVGYGDKVSEEMIFSFLLF